jgi:hypothetical protein
MRIYYRGPDAFLTDEHLTWNGPERVDFAIRDLREVGRVQSVAAGLSAWTVLVVSTVLAFFVAGWLVLAPATTYPLSFLVLAVSVATLVVRQRRKVSLWQVQATYHGSRVTIYASSDERVFNQVTRALCRAIQDARSSSAPYRLAA